MDERAIPDLSKARILVTNDDGIRAPGIAVLERVARALSSDVWVVAPESEQSAVAHSLTVRRPLRMRDLGSQRFWVDGTPTDSVLLAVREILADHPPDLVLSGINGGSNLGEDVTYSGTVAAAMEATLLGLPAIALSQTFSADGPIRWQTAERHAPTVIRRLAAAGWPGNVLVNVNFPDVEPDGVGGVVTARQGKRKLGDELVKRIDPHGRPYFWVGGQRPADRGDPGTDLAAIARGAVSITPLRVDFTDFETMARLDTVLK